MSITTLNVSHGGGFRKDDDGKGHRRTDSREGVAKIQLKSIDELDLICDDLITGFREDLSHGDVMMMDGNADEEDADYNFWISRARESWTKFNDSLNDYLVYKNERKLELIDYNYLYIYYKLCLTIVHDILPKSGHYDTTLSKELLDNDMYFNDIKTQIIKRSENSVDPLLARFNELKRSFNSYTTHSFKNQVITPLIELDSIPRSKSPTEPLQNLSIPKLVSPPLSPPSLPLQTLNSIQPPKLSEEEDFFKYYNDKEAITPLELNDLMSRYPTSILVIDYRSTQEFDNMHIFFANSLNVIHIDPVLINSSSSSVDIEQSMITNSDHERKLFKDRHAFQLIVIYDQTSAKFHDTRFLAHFIDVLKSDTSRKPLIRHPIVLKGGLQNWIRVFGTAGVASNVGIIRDDFSIERREDSLARPVPIPSRANTAHTNGDFYNKSISPSSNSLDRSNYNRSLTDFFSTKFQLQFPKVQVDIDKPANVIHSPKRNSVSNDQALLQAQQRQKLLDKFNNELVIISGISNMGNTCYMNCILQCLVGTKQLTNFFLMKDYENKINLKSRLGSQGIISRGFFQVINDMYNKSVVEPSAKTYYTTPQRFKQIIGSLNADFKGTQQQDCSEFLNFLLDSLHEDLNQRGDSPKFPPLTPEEEAHREKMSIRLAASIEWEKYLKTDFSSIVEYFQGQYLSRLQCTVCKQTSTTYNPFSTLTIPIPENEPGPISLSRCFEEFCRSEILEGDDLWFCPRCNKKQRSTKTMRISILPKNLIVHLKRFKLGRFVTKLDTFVNYPEKISLLKYWPQVENEADAFKLRNFPDRGQTPPFNYKLYAVVNHFGTLRGGHYTSFVDKSESTGNGWCYFDDTSVKRNCDLSKVINQSAYVLFYKRI